MQARSRTAGLAAAVALAASAQLACGTGRESTEGTADRASRADDAPVRLSGCVERGAIPGSFVLTHATTAVPEPGQAQGPGGWTPATGPAAPGESYTVMTGDGTDLGAYVGKRVVVSGHFAVAGDQSGRAPEPVGTVGSGAPPHDAAGSAGAPPGTPGVPGSRGSAPGSIGSGASAASGDSTAATEGPSAAPSRQLTARSVRELADTCAPQ
jgi:hypothetical protein